jgi:hypothetical protein
VAATKTRIEGRRQGGGNSASTAQGPALRSGPGSPISPPICRRRNTEQTTPERRKPGAGDEEPEAALVARSGRRGAT